MSPAAIQLLVLAGVAVFLILKLKNVLGTREGFEKPPLQAPEDDASNRRAGFEVIEGGPDRDITDHAGENSAVANALAEMKGAEPSFNVGEFLQGARGAYEMILMGFERGDMDAIRPFLSDDIAEAFEGVVQARADQNLTVEAEFIGVRETTLENATFDSASREGELEVRFVGELTSFVRDAAGDIVEGDPKEVKRQKDVWTFARVMGSDNPNWQLVATGG
ncbi:Tim44/TimA family putative adaptor protein [Cochlodiniinecator piscidefendens]|uniref:Tim44/TimA family putative adaptor protein n=1 Tax=Cochlodiniinecator piscidefendens TaxID=2715756 RepID=UPI00140D61D2|nr:Tim44/TimA family putative adaptor protein [Cochlodiniinecator piscidefendens]